MKRGEVDVFFWVLVIMYLLGGVMIWWVIGSAYSAENTSEAIGFRQSAVLEAYNQAHDLQLYTRLVAQQSFFLAVVDFFMSGLREDALEGEALRCGTVGEYLSWFNGGSCVPDIRSELPVGLRQQFLKHFDVVWSHEVVPDTSTYAVRYKDGELFGEALQEVTLPVVGVKEGLSSDAFRVAVTQRQRLEGGDSVLCPRFVPDGDRRGRLQTPSHIVMHYTANNGLEQAKDILLGNGLSAHYLVGRDGSCIQMVSENEVAYHAGGCGDPNEKCALTGMNQKSIGIEMVNYGWWHRDNGDNKQPFAPASCPDDYVPAPRDCSYESYDAYPVNGYDGKAACLADPKNICWQPYTEAQVEAVQRLVADIAARNGISPEDIISHESIKAEKYDPGPLFDMTVLRNFVRTNSDPVTVSSSGLGWVTERRQVAACGSDRLEVFSDAGDDVFALAPGEVLSTGCDDCVAIRHSETLVSVVTGVEKTVRPTDVVVAGERVGRAVSDRLVVEFFDQWGGTAQLPLCHFADIENIPAGDNCAAYTAERAGRQVFDPQVFQAECVDVVALEQSECSVNTNVQSSPEVELTLANLESFQHKGDSLLSWARAAAASRDAVDVAFLLAVVTQESKGNPFAVSWTGCAGIAQFCFNTAQAVFPQPVSLTACSCASGRSCSADVDPSTCDLRDDRFDPEISLFASAKYLAGFLEEYEGLDDKLYFAAARYNSGTGKLEGFEGLAAGLARCGSNPDWECVKPFIRPEGRDFAEKVVGYAEEWGLVTPAGSCGGVSVKGLGGLSVPLDWAVPVVDVNTPLQSLTSWATTTASINDDLANGVAAAVRRDPSAWSLEEGFCESVPQLNFLQEVVRNIQDCETNNQDACFCDFLPPIPDAVQELDNELYLVFDDEGVISLHGDDWFGDDDFGSVQYKALTEVFLDQQRDAEKVVFEFDQSGIQEVLVVVDGKEKKTNNIPYFYTSNLLFGYSDVPGAEVCFSTQEHFAFCAFEEFIEQRPGEPAIPVKFGLRLNDTVLPGQSVAASLVAPIPVTPAFLFTFAVPTDPDVSGVFLYCSHDSMTREVTPVRIYREDLDAAFGEFTYALTSCNGEPLANVFERTYTVAVQSFDYGGNENTARDRNEASISYRQVPPSTIYTWVPDLPVS